MYRANDMRKQSRRELLAAFLGLPAAMAGCSRGHRRLPPAGEIVGPSFSLGHRLGDTFRPQPAGDHWSDVGVVIVGGGVAGLSAAWRLLRAGVNDFVLLELEGSPGGTSRSGASPIVPYPWGAHYLPVPMKENRALVTLLDEMGLLEGRDEFGEPVVAEQFLCREPEERVFHDGRWHDGLYLSRGASEEDIAELDKFQRLVRQWAAWRDGRGRRAFAIPVAACSDDPEVTALDRVTMTEWLDEHGLRSGRLRWLVDYACRDDYGLRAEHTSAWAGLFYFASRLRESATEPQPLITWPEGNGRLVGHFAAQARALLRLGQLVTEIVPVHDQGRWRADVIAFDADSSTVHGFRAGQVIFAAPQFVGSSVIRGLGDERGAAIAEFQFGAWMVANLILSDRPRELGFPLAWDNVLYDSPSLGYVVATHQRCIDYGPTVFSYYFPFCDADAAAGRQRLLSLDWNECADIVLTDLAAAHPEIHRLVERLDVMRWGHGMVRPRPGFVWSRARSDCARPFHSVHFAHSELSGVALFEEAFFHGLRAAEAVLTDRGQPFESMI